MISVDLSGLVYCDTIWGESTTPLWCFSRSTVDDRWCNLSKQSMDCCNELGVILFNKLSNTFPIEYSVYYMLMPILDTRLLAHVEPNVTHRFLGSQMFMTIWCFWLALIMGGYHNESCLVWNILIQPILHTFRMGTAFCMNKFDFLKYYISVPWHTWCKSADKIWRLWSSSYIQTFQRTWILYVE